MNIRLTPQPATVPALVTAVNVPSEANVEVSTTRWAAKLTITLLLSAEAARSTPPEGFVDEQIFHG